MLVRLNVVLLCLVDILSACIPTQQADSVATTTTTTTTTTVATTTTIPPDPASPCTGCPKIYDTTCAGFVNLVDPWCAPASTVGVSYVLGVIKGFGDSNTCSTTYSCPAGTTSQYVLFGLTLPGPPLVIAYCQQNGPKAGNWYYGIPPLATPVRLKSLTCVGVTGGK